MYLTLEKKVNGRWAVWDTYDTEERGTVQAAVSAAWEFGRLKIPVRIVNGLPAPEQRDCGKCRYESVPVEKTPCCACDEMRMNMWEPKANHRKSKTYR